MMYVLLTILGLFFALFALNEYYLWVVMGNLQEVQIVKGKNNRRKYDAVAFGSAYCRNSIAFGDYNGFNFGIGSQFFYYTDKMLREIAPQCLKPGGTVFLIIADLVFAEEGKGLYGPERYQLMLSRKTLGGEFDIRTYFKVRFPLVYNPLLIKKILGYIYYKLKGKASPKISVLNESQAKEAALDRCNSWCREFGLKNTVTADFPQSLTEKFVKTRVLLTGMIQFCLDNGYKPVLVVTPVSSAMNELLSDEFVNTVLFENIKQSNVQNVPFLDYLRDERFSDYTCYNQSADLLNMENRLKFTDLLLKDCGLTV